MSPPVPVTVFMHSLCPLCLFFQVVYVVLSLCVGVLCVLKFGKEEICTRILGQVQGDATILFGKVGLWFLVLLFTAYTECHHSRARSRGYLDFYRRMQRVKHLPFYMHSTGRSPTMCCRCMWNNCPQDGSNVQGGICWLFSCRKRPAAPRCGCTTGMSSENLHDSQHPCAGALGGVAVSGPLHR